jgi:repressor LexA
MGGPREVTTSEVLALIESFIRENGCPPTVRELVDETGLSGPSAVHYHLTKLKAVGMIDWIPGKARTIRVLT